MERPTWIPPEILPVEFVLELPCSCGCGSGGGGGAGFGEDEPKI
ncbi:StsA family sactipeptide RiPP [Streptomyces sp. NPDC020096]|jgi:hypothetical protein